MYWQGQGKQKLKKIRKRYIMKNQYCRECRVVGNSTGPLCLPSISCTACAGGMTGIPYASTRTGFVSSPMICSGWADLRRLKNMNHTSSAMMAHPPTAAPTLIPAMAPVLSPSLPPLLIVWLLPLLASLDSPVVVGEVSVLVDDVEDVEEDVDDSGSSKSKQFPNIGWHPDPQYVLSPPQNPFVEQQSPYVLPWQVTLLVRVAPQDPVRLIVWTLASLQVPNSSWHPSPQ
jgi:hypothetical protein